MKTHRPGHTAVAGLCWGDEGKGKVVDLLSPAFDVVVRYNGGANAGHTVCTEGRTFALHLIPAGLLRENVTAVIGPGVVLDPGVALGEIDALAARGIRADGRLLISDRAHVVAEYHKVEDRLSERAAGDEGRIGTTARGIGPCYADKMRRTTAIRVCDLLATDRLPALVERIIETKRRTFQALYGDDGGLSAHSLCEQLSSAAERLRPFVCDTTAFLQQALADGKRLLFEGANGALLDVDHGTYPYVTSSSAGPWGICAGAGVPPLTVVHYVGVTKAYATRVGSGPFPSELGDATGDAIRQRGREYGTTTGRPRRCGWLDAVALRYSARLGGIGEVALMHLDTVSGLEHVSICTGYEINGRIVETLPADGPRLARARPIIETHPGWADDLRNCLGFEDLPGEARRYIERVETLIGAPVTLVSVGPDRGQTLIRGGAGSVFRALASIPGA